MFCLKYVILLRDRCSLSTKLVLLGSSFRCVLLLFFAILKGPKVKCRNDHKVQVWSLYNIQKINWFPFGFAFHYLCKLVWIFNEILRQYIHILIE